jgi:hypothetical protein
MTFITKKTHNRLASCDDDHNGPKAPILASKTAKTLKKAPPEAGLRA